MARKYRRDSQGRFAGGGGGSVGRSSSARIGGRTRASLSRAARSPVAKAGVRAGAGVIGAGLASAAISRGIRGGSRSSSPGLYRNKGTGSQNTLSPIKGMSLRDVARASGGGPGSGVYRSGAGRAESVGMGRSGTSLRGLAKASAAARPKSGVTGTQPNYKAAAGRRDSVGRNVAKHGYGFSVKGGLR